MKSLFLVFVCVLPAPAATITIYSGLPGNAGNGSSGPLDFSQDTLAGSFFSPDVNFPGILSPWSPFGLMSLFGADITATIQVASDGTYTFGTTSDDGSLLFVDGQLVVNNNFSQIASERQGSIQLTAGTHQLEIQYYQGGGGASLVAPLPAGVTYVYEAPPPPIVPALNIYQYSGQLPTLPNGEVPPQEIIPAGAAPVGSIPTTVVNYGLPGSNWFPFGLTQNFSADMQGYFEIPATGSYTFNTGSDDGSYLFIDGLLVVNNGFFQGYGVRQGTVNLTAGDHPFELLYFQGGGGAALTLGLPTGVDIESTPEPGLWLPLAALAGFCAILHRRRMAVKRQS